jgi:hypothetical protein
MNSGPPEYEAVTIRTRRLVPFVYLLWFTVSSSCELICESSVIFYVDIIRCLVLKN